MSEIFSLSAFYPSSLILLLRWSGFLLVKKFVRSWTFLFPLFFAELNVAAAASTTADWNGISGERVVGWRECMAAASWLQSTEAALFGMEFTNLLYCRKTKKCGEKSEHPLAIFSPVILQSVLVNRWILDPGSYSPSSSLRSSPRFVCGRKMTRQKSTFLLLLLLLLPLTLFHRRSNRRRRRRALIA